MGVKINYKGNQIAAFDEDGTKTLNTMGTYCEGDISVSYEKPSAAEVTSGTKAISSNGIHDVTSYANAEVSVLPNVKYIERTITADIGSAQWLEFNPDGDEDIKAHRADETMQIMWYRKDAATAATYHQLTCLGNRAVNSYYGSCLLKTSSGASASFINTPLTDGTSAAAKKTVIDTDGVIKACSGSQYPIRAGTYVCIATW